MHRLTLLAALLCPGIVTATGCTPPATLDQRQNSGRWTLQPQARKPTPVKWRHQWGQSPYRPTVGTHHQQQVPTDRGHLSKAGWVRLRGRERHGWRDRASMDGFTASRVTGPTPPPHG